MKIIGLTGGIAMGKSTAAALLRQIGAPVHDADAAVHRLYAPGGKAVPLLAEYFPEAVVCGAVARERLGQIIFDQSQALKTLETLVHPPVRHETQIWLKWHQRRHIPLVILDIPLLFETGQDREVDQIWVVNCPAFLQAQRALRRPGMDRNKLQHILARQVPQHLRLRRADQVFQTGRGKASLFRELKVALG